MGPSNQYWDVVPVSRPVYQTGAGTTLRDVVAVLFRRKRIILGLFCSMLLTIGLAVTWLQPYLDPPRYVSGLKFIFKKDRFDAVVTPADRAVPGLTTTVSPQEIHSEIELLKSSDVLERLAREAQVAPLHAGPAAPGERETRQALRRLSQDLVAEPVVAGRNTTNLIAVRYTASDPAEVLRVLNRLPEIYLEKYLSVNRRPAALEYFRSQSESSEQQLREAEEELAEFEKQQPALAVEGHQHQARQKLLELEKQRAETEAAIREAESRAAELARQLTALPATTTTTRPLPEPAYLGRLKTQLLELENQRAQVTFYREIEQLDRRIGELRQAIASETQAWAGRAEENVPNPLRAPFEAEVLRNQVSLAGLRARRASLIEQERTGREQLAAARLIAAENAVPLAELTRNVKAAEENSLYYRKKYAEAREADLLDQKRVFNVSVAEGPRSPERVEKRGAWFYLAIGFLLAAAGASAAGFTAEMLDHSIHTPRQLENHSSLAVLACLPESKR